MTDKYDENDATHKHIKKLIEIGDGLPDLDTVETALKAVKGKFCSSMTIFAWSLANNALEAGFELVESKDLALYDPKNPIPWYQPFAPGFSLSGFRTTSLGKMATHYLVKTLETLGLVRATTSQSNSLGS